MGRKVDIIKKYQFKIRLGFRLFAWNVLIIEILKGLLFVI